MDQGVGEADDPELDSVVQLGVVVGLLAQPTDLRFGHYFLMNHRNPGHDLSKFLVTLRRLVVLEYRILSF